jgi:flavin-dependent dehydrogenase
MVEIPVAGAGPAGLAAALTLARAGARAVVYERRHEVGARHHGDFQGLENYSTRGDVLDELAGIGITTEFDCHPVAEAVLYGPDGRPWRYRASTPLFYMVRRGVEAGSLDQGLKRQALAHDIELRFGTALAETASGVRATGPRGSYAIVVGYLFPTTLPDALIGVLSERLAPQGYAYLVTAGGRATLACCIFADRANYRRYLDRTVAFFQARAGIDLAGARRFGGTGNVRLPATARCNGGGTLLAGEAAGFQDALWGFGLRYAMVSGHLAARALLERDPASYDRRWRARFGGLIRASLVNRYFFSRLGDRGYGAFLRRLGSADDAREWLHHHYAPSAWKDLWYLLLRGAH